MRFPPIKPDRALLWITLRPDDTVIERYAALRALLKDCRMHPLDTTAAAEVLIVDTGALRAHLAAIRDVLGAGDMLHLVTAVGDRLAVEVIAPPDVEADPLPHRPPWLPII